MSALAPPAAALAAAAADLTQQRLLFPLEPWLIFLILAGLAAVFALLYAREASTAGPLARGALALLRLLVCAALVATVTGPACERVRREAVDSWVLVLVDQSVSMSLEDRYGDEGGIAAALAAATGLGEEEVAATPRIELVRRTLERDRGAFLRELAAKNRVKLFGFGQARRLTAIAELDRLDPDAPAAETDAAIERALAAVRALEPGDPETAVGDSLALALGETRGRRMAGVVLFTDGRSNADLTPPVKAAEGTRGVPVYPIGVGNPAEPRDVAVTDLQARDVVIAGDTLVVKVLIESRGFVGGDRFVELEVSLDDEVLVSEPVELQGGGARQEVTAPIKPGEPGEYTLQVQVKPRPGELITDNNQLSQRLKVVDKRIKVLLVDDLPRWEFRRLKMLLVRDDRMEAHTFQISADPTVRQDCSPGLEPLTELPRTREELFQYHVVILGDVNPTAPELEGRLELFREFVDDGGGGLLLVAGRRFMPGRYADTPLEALLPVEIDRDDLGDMGGLGAITSSFRMQLTRDGVAHQILQLEEEAELNQQTWAALPGFFWYYKPLAVKPVATVLATHPSAVTEKDQPVPIFSLLQSGAGSTMLVSSDETWRWRAGVEDLYTQKFWGQAVRYLSTGRLLKSRRFGITTDKAVYDLGERVTIQAEVNDQSLKPSEEETQVVYLEGPGGEQKRLTLTRPPNKKGQYGGQEVVTRVGTYKVFIAAGAPDAESAGEELAVRVFQVQVPVLEKQDPKMDERTLRRMAETSGGHFVPLHEARGVPARVGAIEEWNDVVEDAVLVLMRWEAIVAVVVLLALEWALRKKWKMW